MELFDYLLKSGMEENIAASDKRRKVREND